MRVLISLVLWLACLFPVLATNITPQDIKAALKSIPAYAPDRLLVRFKPGIAASNMASMHGRTGGQALRNIPGINVQVVKIPAGQVQQKLKAYRADPNVEFAEPDYHRVLVLPNEGTDLPPPIGTGVDFFPEQWGLNNTGQLLVDPTVGIPFLNGTPDADIDAPEAWDINTGDVRTKIAILDTGVDCSSVDLAGKCIEQISFVSDFSSTVDDLVSHGTHIAGIAAANTDNDKGTAGVSWNASIGNLKACYEYQLDLLPPLGFFVTVGLCPVSASAEAITYAADNGYHVINMSYASDNIDAAGEPIGPSTPPNVESAAISYAWSKGVVMVAAAGNDSNTIEVYPAAYDEVIAVAATDRFDNLASFSTFGNSWVSMMAPGENILSTEPDANCELLVSGYVPGVDDCLTWKSGTSMSSPHVAGAVSLLWSQLYPGQSPSGCIASNGMPCNVIIRDHIVNSADTFGALGQNFLAWSQNGRLNLLNMLSDGDGDSITVPGDNCPDIANVNQTDTDGDTIGDLCDNCTSVFNTNQADLDGDRIGDLCEAPEAHGFWPGTASSGELVHIFGLYFDETQSQVSFNGITASGLFTVDNTHIVAIVPGGDLAGPITVTTPQGSDASATDFAVSSPDVTIDGFWPSSGLPGAFIHVFGDNFDMLSTQVSFNGTPAAGLFVVDPTHMIVITPLSEASKGPITIITPAGSAISADNFIVLN